jgi:hypothetical protein
MALRVPLTKHLTKTQVVRGLRKRVREGKPVSYAAVGKEDLRLSNAARRQFGSHVAALRAAGIDPKQVRLRTAKYTKDDLDRLSRECSGWRCSMDINEPRLLLN